MGAKVETPPALRGGMEEQIAQLSSYLFRLSEGLNVELDRVQSSENPSQPSPGNAMSMNEYRELRDMIGTSAKELVELMDEQIPKEVIQQLRAAEESGDFDGNGIASATFNDDYSLTLGFTDGTYFKTPSLRGEKGLAAVELWINPNPGSSFAAQTINASISGLVLVLARQAASDTAQISCIAAQATKGRLVGSGGYYRDFSVSATGISFESATDNNYCIPVAVYAI